MIDVFFGFVLISIVFFFKQKTAYEMRISDWSSDVCSSDLNLRKGQVVVGQERHRNLARELALMAVDFLDEGLAGIVPRVRLARHHQLEGPRAMDRAQDRKSVV